MKPLFLITTILCICIISTTHAQTTATKNGITDSIIKIDMTLSAFGVESDNVPSITASIDFIGDTSICIKSFYNPAYKGSTYSLTKNEIKAIQQVLSTTNLETLKKEYTSNISDQPRSTLKIYTTQKTFIFNDYGLQGDYPLQELYKIVYKY